MGECHDGYGLGAAPHCRKNFDRPLKPSTSLFYKVTGPTKGQPYAALRAPRARGAVVWMSQSARGAPASPFAGFCARRAPLGARRASWRGRGARTRPRRAALGAARQAAAARTAATPRRSRRETVGVRPAPGGELFSPRIALPGGARDAGQSPVRARTQTLHENVVTTMSAGPRRRTPGRRHEHPRSRGPRESRRVLRGGPGVGNDFSGFKINTIAFMVS